MKFPQLKPGLVGFLLALLLCYDTDLDARQMKQEADAVFLNADIYTGAPAYGQGGESSTRIQRTEAMAIRGDRVLAIGTSKEIRRYRGPKTLIIDLRGRFVLPGFNDAHLHLAAGGLEKLQVDLAGTKSLEDLKARVAAHTKASSNDGWIVGRGWDETAWPDRKLPNRHDIDGVTGDRPAYLTRVDGHVSVVNTAALKAAGIGTSSENPAGGEIDRDPKGQPTGILRETAEDIVFAKIPQPTPALRRRAIELALAEAACNGVTSAQDNSTWEDFLIYEDLQREGKLTLRITEWLPFDHSLTTLTTHRARHPQTDLMLHTGMLKAFMDGSLGSHTAALLAPYSDQPKNHGLRRYDASKLKQMLDERAEARFQTGFHAIGDGAVQTALDAFAEAERYARERTIPPLAEDGFRFRIEHAQVVQPGQFRRFRELHVIASMQPNHLLTDMNWAELRLGAERARFSYPWKSFLDNRVALAFGTDFPVEPITPFRGLYAAITRKNEAGTREYFPEERITLDQAIAAYTTGSAYAEFAEHEKGTLKPGMLADFVVLDRDPTRVSPQELLHTRVLRTVVGGRTVYEAPPSSTSACLGTTP